MAPNAPAGYRISGSVAESVGTAALKCGLEKHGLCTDGNPHAINARLRRFLTELRAVQYLDQDHACPSRAQPVSVRMKSWRRWERAAWAKSTGRATRGWTAKWLSKSCPPRSPTIPSAKLASNRKPAPPEP